MKIISKSSINRENSILLFKTNSGSNLWRIGIDQYAIYKAEAEDPIIAFESQAFSWLIDPITEEIADLGIIGCNCALCDDHLFVEIRILLPDQSSYYLDSNDRAVEVKNIQFAVKDDSPAPTPCKHWSLPEQAPYKHMFVTNLLAEQIETMQSAATIEEIAQRMWMEADCLKNPHSINKVVHVNGEFLDYCINELRCGRVLFMTHEEISIYAPNPKQV